VDKDTLRYWREDGGSEMEAALASGAVALLRSQWLIRFAEREGSVLPPRQALPKEAFFSLSQVQNLGLTGVVCISHCWLQPDHPDPRGRNLRVVARALRTFSQEYPNMAVFFDFCSIHQKCRGADGKPGPRVLGFSNEDAGAVGRFASEDVLFKQALGSLGIFYSHPNTHVWMLTAFRPITKIRSATSGKAMWRRTRSAAGASARRRGRQW
jgi:hypothetical protein